jgi:nitrile hydratase
MQAIQHNPAKYKAGDIVSVAVRYPIGHYRVPMYMRGKEVKVVRVLGRYVNPEEEGFGKNAGDKTWCYLVTIDQRDLWPEYDGDTIDRLEIEIFEPWLQPIKTISNEQQPPTQA